MARRHSASLDLYIGVTIMAGIILIAGMILAWGNQSTLFGKSYLLVVHTSHVGGLREGAPVEIGGLRTGTVQTIEFRPGSTEIQIICQIAETVPIPNDSRARVSTKGMVGDAFLEIIPGKSMTMVNTKATTVALASRLESSLPPDFSDILDQMGSLGTQLTSISQHIDGIIGDPQVQQDIKTSLHNLALVSAGAERLVARGDIIIDNLGRATANIADTTEDVKENIATITGGVAHFITQATEIVDTAKETLETVSEGVATAKEGIAAAKKAIDDTIGRPETVASINQGLANFGMMSKGLREMLEKNQANIDTTLANVAAASTKVNEAMQEIDPKAVGEAVNQVSEALRNVTATIGMIRRELTLALSINKAADRIINLKFKEMERMGLRSSDAQMREITRWVNEAFRQGGYLPDPQYPDPSKRPYNYEP